MKKYDKRTNAEHSLFENIMVVRLGKQISNFKHACHNFVQWLKKEK